MKQFRKFSVALALALLTSLVTVDIARAAGWPIVDFKVIHGPPGNTVTPNPDADTAEPGLLDQAGEFFDELTGDSEEARQRAMADAAWSRLVEGFLGDAARRFAAEGFDPPSMPVITSTRKYAVYLYDYPNSSEKLGLLNNFGCALKGELQWMSINRARFVYTPMGVVVQDFRFDEPLDEKDLYITLAHELFHAIQGTYDSRYNSIRYCEEGSSAKSGRDVVLEGGAEGAAVYVASKRWPNLFDDQRSNSLSGKYTLGRFEYNETFLSVRNRSNETYLTSSFWRFFADRYDGLGYMDHLLRQPVPPGASHRQRADWLDRSLKSYNPIGKQLYILYPHAMSEIASYAESRYKKETRVNWQTGLFQPCLKLELDPTDREPAEVLIEELKPIASRCLRLSWKSLSTPRDLKIEAIVLSTGEADQLHLGMSTLLRDAREEYCWKWRKDGGSEASKDSCLYEKVFVQIGPQENRVKTWLTAPELFTGSGEATLVLSNIAPIPSQTEAIRDIVFRVQFAKSLPSVSHKDLSPPRGMLNNPASRTGMGGGAALSPQGMLYGLQPGKGPLSPLDLIPLEVLEAGPDGTFESGRKRYGIVLSPKPKISPGYVGPLHAMVSLDEGERIATNYYCADGGEKPVGQVLGANEKVLHLRMDASLCQFQIGKAPPFPVTDYLLAELILPFGWRYFVATAPRDIETPGIKIYMDRYQARMAGVPDLSSIMEMLGVDSSVGGGGSGAGSGSGSGNPAGGEGFSGCDCSCEALAELQEECQLLDGSDIAAAMSCARCMSECMQDLMNCGK